MNTHRDYSDIENYVRVGRNTYLKEFGCFENENSENVKYVKNLIKWDMATLREDVDKKDVKFIEKYDKFVNVPMHVNYKQTIDGAWNLYHPLSYKHKKGSWKTIERLLRHIFKKDYEMALDYLTSLYVNPLQSLPIIALVSKENKTGKSAFVKLLEALLENNMATINSEDFLSSFNSDWAPKTMVAIEEAFWKDKRPYNKIKILNSTSKIGYHAKGKDKTPIDNALHFIFCSNNEDDFIKIDATETRLWVIKVGKITDYIINLESQIAKEIGAFAEFLSNREIEYTKTHTADRFLFHSEDYATPALEKLKIESENDIAKQIRYAVTEYFHIYKRRRTLELSPTDLIEYFNIKGATKHQINRIIELCFPNAQKMDSSKHHSFLDPKECVEIRKNGRYTIFYVEDFVPEGVPELEELKELEDETTTPTQNIFTQTEKTEETKRYVETQNIIKGNKHIPFGHHTFLKTEEPPQNNINNNNKNKRRNKKKRRR